MLRGGECGRDEYRAATDLTAGYVEKRGIEEHGGDGVSGLEEKKVGVCKWGGKFWNLERTELLIRYLP